MPNAKAYQAIDKRGPSKSYALICRPDLPVRIGACALKGLHPPLLQLLDWGIVDGPGNRKLIAVVYDQPTGGRFLRPGPKFEHIPEAVFVKKVIHPSITR